MWQTLTGTTKNTKNDKTVSVVKRVRGGGAVEKARIIPLVNMYLLCP